MRFHILHFRVLLTPFFISHAKQRLVIGYRLHLFFVSGMTGSLIAFCMLLRYILQVQCVLGLKWSKFNVDKYSTSQQSNDIVAMVQDERNANSNKNEST